jgi:iron complex outermembrane receptor protein
MSLLRRAVLAPCLLALPALAQTEIAPVTVVGERERLATESNEAARLRLWSSPGANTVVEARDFQERAGATSVRDMLEFTPGVFSAPKFGEDARLSIRGSGLARNFHLRGIRVSQDGIPLNQADGSGDIQEIDPLAYQRVEVLRGGNAFALGANTLGGAINFVTNTGRSSPGGTARLEGGSDGFFRAQGAYGLSSGPYEAYFSNTWTQSNGYRHNSAGQANRVNTNASTRWNDQVETRIIFSANNIWQQIPGAVSRESALNSPRTPASANERLNYQRNINTVRLGTLTAIQATPELRFEIGGSVVDRRLYHPIFELVRNQSVDFNGFARGIYDGQVMGLRNRASFGFNFAEGGTTNIRYVNLSGIQGNRTYTSDDLARTSDLYLENALYVLPRLALVAGLQGGFAYRSSRNLLNPALSGSGNWNWVNPRIGVLHDVTPTVQAYANLSWSTEPPTLSDLIALVPQGGFSRLNAQRAYTAEIGTRGQHGRVAWEVAAYRSWLRDEIQLFLGPTPGSSFAQNAGRTTHQGVEVALNYTLLESAGGERLSTRAAWTFSDFRFSDDPTYRNNQLPGAPRHTLRQELRYTHSSGAWIAPNIDVVPQGFYADNANTLRSNPYTLFGLRGGAELVPGRVTAFFDARNLGNTRYISSASVAPRAVANQALFEAGFGRSVFAGLQVRF